MKSMKFALEGRVQVFNRAPGLVLFAGVVEPSRLPSLSCVAILIKGCLLNNLG
jgi:hypothetical protein